MPTPVFYPGSIERTSFREKDEPKGYLTLEIVPAPGTVKNSPGRGTVSQWQFHRLPARPMTQLELRANGMKAHALKSLIEETLKPLPVDSVVKIRVHGRLPDESLEILSAESLRSLTLPTMNLTVTLPDYRKGQKDH
jgi:hypothetical protein